MALYPCRNNNQIIFLFLLMNLILLSEFVLPSRSFDPLNPPKLVNDVCERCGKELNTFCIAFYNSGSIDNADMRFFAYYTRDFAENNATDVLEKINTKLIPSLPDPYVQAVLDVCKDAFTHLKDELADRVSTMIVEKGTFREAKAWVHYGIGLVDSCRNVCSAKPINECPLQDNVRDTESLLRLLLVVLDLLTEGVM